MDRNGKSQQDRGTYTMKFVRKRKEFIKKGKLIAIKREQGTGQAISGGKLTDFVKSKSIKQIRIEDERRRSRQEIEATLSYLSPFSLPTVLPPVVHHSRKSNQRRTELQCQ